LDESLFASSESLKSPGPTSTLMRMLRSVKEMYPSAIVRSQFCVSRSSLMASRRQQSQGMSRNNSSPDPGVWASTANSGESMRFMAALLAAATSTANQDIQESVEDSCVATPARHGYDGGYQQASASTCKAPSEEFMLEADRH
jgi:hypothetical protein